MTAKLGEVRACVFDAYGTLFDFASATRASRIRASISSRSTGWGFKPRRFRFSPQMRGTLMRRHPLV
jgi:FMN phosphatase YigB (HAD superfamily)